MPKEEAVNPRHLTPTLQTAGDRQMVNRQIRKLGWDRGKAAWIVV